jgi:hypothetical protein
VNIEELETQGHVVVAGRVVARLITLVVGQHLLCAAHRKARLHIKAKQVQPIMPVVGTPILLLATICLILGKLIVFILYKQLVDTVVADPCLHCHWRSAQHHQCGRHQRLQKLATF